MKETIFDDIVRALMLGGLALFGLRGALPDLAASGQIAWLFAFGIAGAVNYAICKHSVRCEPACDPKFCRAI